MDRLVAIAVERRYLMVGLLFAVLIGGAIAFKQLNIEAYPDPTPPMVDVVTQSPGLSAEEIERYITIPIETQVAGIKNLNTIRSVSLYGLSDVKLQFSFDYPYDEALQQVLNRLSQLAPLPGNVPPGVKIERIYDRKDLIDITTATVLHNMVVGILLIVLLQWIFLGNLRSALIVGATIPFALFFAVIILVLRGESANLLSVGAIDFGLIVDATVIMVEAIFRRLTQTTALSELEQSHISTDTTMGMKSHAILSAAADVSRSIFFAAAIIIAAFLPLFTLSGVEGNIFGPMARTYAYALAGGLLATFTVTPALSAIILPAHVHETETWIMARLHRLYVPVLNWAVGNRKLIVAGAIGIVVMTAVCGRLLGLEFLPKLEEGNLWIRATLPPTISLETGNAYVNEMRKLIRSRPEVESVESQHGRPDDGTDAAGFFNAEFFAPLKPVEEWPGSHDKDKVTAELLAQLQAKFPGVEFNFSQYLQDNVSEAVSGVKGENSIKLYGNDLQALTDTANKIKNVLSTVDGITDLGVFTSLGQPTVQIDIDRAKAARYGLSPGDINATIKVAIGGDTAGDLYEPGSDRHFPIIVRLAPEYRKSAEAIQNLRIGAQGPNGITQVPLSEVATIKLVSGAAYIYREQQERYLPIKFSVRERDLGGAIREAQQKVEAQIKLPPGSRLEWVGEFGNLQDAIHRLSIVVPISLTLIAVLLWFNFGSMVDTLLAMSVIPMAIFGGVLGLLISGIPFSVSAAIGFIALFGIAVMDGIIILSQYNQLIDEGVDRIAAVIRTGELQLRPVLMNSVVAGVGLLPAALSAGIGSQVQTPLAIVVVTGMMLAPLVILVTLPVLISFFSRRAR